MPIVGEVDCGLRLVLWEVSSSQGGGVYNDTSKGEDGGKSVGEGGASGGENGGESRPVGGNSLSRLKVPELISRSSSNHSVESEHTNVNFVERDTAESIGLRMADFHTGPAGNWLTLSNRSGPDIPKAVTKSITHIEEMDFRSFMVEGVDGEFYFVPEGGFAENTVDSDDTPSEEDEVILVGCDAVDKAKNQKVSTSSKASKAFGNPSDPLNVDSDPDIHENSTAKELNDLRIGALVVVLDNVMNRRTRELMSTLTKARAACDVIQEKES
ncbi:hypothetical protein Tco_1153035 [Tanacetum coccineum]